MTKELAVGDHVRWNSEAGRITGVIKKKHTKDFEFRGRTRRCSPEQPQWEVESDKTGHLAVHKSEALHRTD